MSAVAWVGLALGVANLVVWAFVAVAVVKLRAKVAPWLTMLGLGSTETPNADIPTTPSRAVRE